MESVGFKYTGRRCRRKECAGKLRDQVLDWDDALPEPELCRAENEAKKAKLALVLGSSLQIVPSGDLPLLTIPDARYKKRKRSSLSSSGGKNMKPVTRKTTGGQLVLSTYNDRKDQFADLVVPRKRTKLCCRWRNIWILKFQTTWEKTLACHVAHASNEDNEDKRIHLKVQIVSQHSVTTHLILVGRYWREKHSKMGKSKEPEQETKRFGGLFVAKRLSLWECSPTS